MSTQTIIATIFAALFGLVIGSFLNVCIYRIPLKEEIVYTRSHCMNCGHQLRWYELIPVLSYLLQRGRCRQCKERISIQYPLVELLNAIGYVWIFLHVGYCLESILYCLATSILIVVAFIDEKTMEIPVSCNYLLALLGVVQLISDWTHWWNYILGAVCISGFLLLLYWITKGRGIGGGDIKLMAAGGLLLGAPRIILGFFIGCILASVIHIVRMKISKVGNRLAFGPYLCGGIWIAIIYGNWLIAWYFSVAV